MVILYQVLVLITIFIWGHGKKVSVEVVTNKKPLVGGAQLLRIRGGMSMNMPVESSGSNDDDQVVIRGSPMHILNGIYTKTDWNMNGRIHFEKNLTIHDVGDGRGGNKLHLYWTGSQWIISYDLDPSLNFNNLLGYSRSNQLHPFSTGNSWLIRVGKSFESVPALFTSSSNNKSNGLVKKTPEFMGVPKILLPLYISFLFDAIATGLAMPLLPFYIMELGANALQLSLVISSNYVAQMIGCLVMGRVSDKYGRRIVLLLCLLASSVSYAFVSKAKTLPGLALARIICGSFGGLVPIMQSCVADVSHVDDRPKYLGRIMATFGFGFVLGPAISAALPQLEMKHKIRVAALLPAVSFVISLLFFKETKKFSSSPVVSAKAVPVSTAPSTAVLLLVLNGFLLMYAFATETIYAMFIKDSFGYGEKTLSTLFAINGLFIGLFQVFLIKPLVNLVGKHVTLVIGNILLAVGMVGIALVRKEKLHFMLFTVHIVGYSIADTALVSLISRYSSPTSQGRDLSFNQAAQACSRVLSPIVAGLLYEKSKQSRTLPVGALPFLVGSLGPCIAVAIPSILFIQSINRKRNYKK